MTTKVQPKATMGEAWAESDRLRIECMALWAEHEKLLREGGYLLAECDRLETEGAYLQAEGNLLVILTAQALYGKDAQIDWVKRGVKHDN